MISKESTHVGITAAIALGAKCELFNLGNSRPEPLLASVQLIENKTGKRASLKRLPMQPGDVPITFASIEKSRSLLGYAPRTSLEEGINAFVDWYKAYHAIAKSRD